MSGFNNMMYFAGVVEDNHDLTNAGRVRVRAFGIHPPRKTEDDADSVPTEHLPWATVLDSSYGVAPVIPSVGDWVFGFFIDGREAQQPMIMGRMPGMHLQTPSGSGVPGEDGYLPPEALLNFGKPDLHRYQGGEGASQGQTLTQRAFANTSIPQANGETFDEPPIMMPENNYTNRVISSKDGDNFIVLGSGEDSANSDYFLISHSSGSVFQIDANGTIFVKAFADKYNTTQGVESNYVRGSSHSTIDEDYTLKIGKSGKIQVNGRLDIECTDFNVRAARNINLDAGVKVNVSGGGVGVFATADDINLVANTNLKALATLGGMYFKCLMPGNPLGDGGAFHVDSYKTNMYSIAYTKIHSTGTPAISTQLLPFPDAGMNGVDISSTTGLKLQSNTAMNLTCLTNLGISAVGTLGISAGATMNLYSVGTLGLGATAAVSLDSVIPAASVLIGNGTAAATAASAAGSITTSLATFVAPGHIASSNVPNVSVTELAKVVKPQEITNVAQPIIPAKTKRWWHVLTSIMRSDDDE
jgi:hypothetical protein